MKTSKVILVLLLICAGLFECFLFVPGFKEKQTRDIGWEDFAVNLPKSMVEQYSGYNKPVVWRVMTDRERQEYISKEGGIPSYQTLDICLIDNFGRAVTNPLSNDFYHAQCGGQNLKDWIAKENKREKEAFEKTGHCVDYLHWKERLEQAELEIETNKRNITYAMYGKIIVSFVALFLFFFILWKLFCWGFNYWDRKRKNAVRKQKGKKYLDLSNEED